MKKMLFLCLIFVSLNTKAIDSNKLIKIDDLNILFLIKKNSFAKVENESDTFYLKSIFKDGEIITMPIFSNSIVKKIKFEYIDFDHKKENLKIIKDHFNSFKNYCFEYFYNDKSIQAVISKCN